MYDRFLNILKNKGISAYKVSKDTGVSQATLTSWKNGSYVPKYDKLKKLADYLGVDISEITGDGECGSKVPIIGQIACGSPVLAEENVEGYAPVCYGVKADFCLIAKGDSMINARITDGDLVFIKRQSMVENGEIAAVLIEDSATLKRIYYYPEKNKLVLNPENPKYEPLVFIGQELSQIQILGKAVGFSTRL